MGSGTNQTQFSLFYAINQEPVRSDADILEQFIGTVEPFAFTVGQFLHSFNGSSVRHLDGEWTVWGRTCITVDNHFMVSRNVSNFRRLFVMVCFQSGLP